MISEGLKYNTTLTALGLQCDEKRIKRNIKNNKEKKRKRIKAMGK